jgi:hypothetical protein
MAEEITDWIKLPHDLQHRFFLLAKDEAKELKQRILDLKGHLKYASQYFDKYFKHVEIKTEELSEIAAIDSSRSFSLSERLGIRYGVIGAGAVILKGTQKREEIFRAKVFRRHQALSIDKSKYLFDLLSTLTERDLALEILDKCDLLILDGSFYSFVYTAQRMKREEYLGEEEIKIIKEIYDKTEKLKRSGKVISIIKRSHTRAIGGYLAFINKSNNPFTKIIDKLILSVLMKEREYFNYHDLIENRPVQLFTQIALLVTSANLENIYEEAYSKIYHPFENLGLPKETIDSMRRLQIRIFKELPPCEIEYPSNIDLNKILNVLSEKNVFNESTNLPLALDLIDNLVEIPSKFTEEFVSEIESRLLEEMQTDINDQELIKIFFSFINPQKRF